MAWIKEIDEQHANDELKKIFQDIKSKRGKLSNIMRVQSLEQNTNILNINNQKNTMISYVRKLTLMPHKISKKDINVLHNEGYSDQAILDIGLITGYFNFVNRLVLGLGVVAQTEEIRGYQY